MWHIIEREGRKKKNNKFFDIFYSFCENVADFPDFHFKKHRKVLHVVFLLSSSTQMGKRQKATKAGTAKDEDIVLGDDYTICSVGDADIADLDYAFENEVEISAGDADNENTDVDVKQEKFLDAIKYASDITSEKSARKRESGYKSLFKALTQYAVMSESKVSERSERALRKTRKYKKIQEK